jgi:hypothetical protein
MANKIYYSATTLTGGAATALDYIDGTGLVDGDIAFVFIGGVLYVYKLNATSGAAESSPWIIAPDTNAGTKRWILQISKGAVVQELWNTTQAPASGSTIMPNDASIPQITDGDEYLTQAITPRSAANILIIEAGLWLSNGDSSALGAALFQDSTPGALAVAGPRSGFTNYIDEFRIIHKMPAGTTSATTFRVRAGSGASTTTRLNSQASAGYGGKTTSYLKVKEIQA